MRVKKPPNNGDTLTKLCLLKAASFVLENAQQEN